MRIRNWLRPDLRDFAGYSSARSTPQPKRASIWLNANEAAEPSASDFSGSLRRYPSPQPELLRESLAGLYGVAPNRLLISRGSDEAIDLVVRASCRPGRDGVLVTPPVFGMYAVCARLQGAPLIESPLRDVGGAFMPDLADVARRAQDLQAKVVFLCSPANPTGRSLAPDRIAELAGALPENTLLVVDEAYAEFSDVPSALSLLDRFDNIAVLRTLSKAHALAAARIGVLIGSPELVKVLRRCQAPYPLSSGSIDSALAALTPASLEATRRRVAATVAERERLRGLLLGAYGVRLVYRSDANFLLARFDDPDLALSRLADAGIVVRDMRSMQGLDNALRISVGRPDENDRVIEALRRAEESAA